MEIIIFIFYLILFCYFISITPFFKKSEIGGRTLIILFLIKIVAGIIYAKFFSLPKNYPGSDTWRFYRFSLAETKWLILEPKAFVTDLFTYSYNKSGNIFSGENTYWNDLKSNVIIKMMAVTNVFTNKSYYTNIIFFNFLFLFGLVALFKLFYQIFPEKKFLIIAGVFLLPSTLFWCSGIHKDGLILSATGVIIYTFFKAVKDRFSSKRIFIILFCSLAVFSLRNYVLFALFPTLFSWLLCEAFPGRNFKVFSAVYITGIAFIFIMNFCFPAIHFLSFITNKRNEFLLLEGGSKVVAQKLSPNFPSFISFFPDAAYMAFFRPHTGEIKSFSYIPAFIENLFLLVLLVISLFYANKKLLREPVIFALIFFSISLILLLGYTVPFTGAIVRYKSFVLPLLVTHLLCINNIPFLNRITNKNVKHLFYKTIL